MRKSFTFTWLCGFQLKWLDFTCKNLLDSSKCGSDVQQSEVISYVLFIRDGTSNYSLFMDGVWSFIWCTAKNRSNRHMMSHQQFFSHCWPVLICSVWSSQSNYLSISLQSKSNGITVKSKWEVQVEDGWSGRDEFERSRWHPTITIFTAYVAFATLVRFILFLRMRVTWGLFKPAMSSSSLGRDLVSQLLSSVPLGNLENITSRESTNMSASKVVLKMTDS